MFDTNARSSFGALKQDAQLYVFSRDLSRMDIQVLSLREYHKHKLPFYFGATYLTSPLSIVPSSLVGGKTNYLREAKTNIVLGPGSYFSDGPRQTTIVVGLFGEAFVNFSYPGVIIAFGFLGWSVRKIGSLPRVLAPTDVRRLLLPALCILPWQLLMEEGDVLFQLILRSMVLPAIIIYVSSRKFTARKADYGSGLQVSPSPSR
jgi:hypothetical protein